MRRDFTRELLVFTVTLTCAGGAWSLFMTTGPVFTLSWDSFGLSESAGLAIEHAGAFMLAVCAVIALFALSKHPMTALPGALAGGAWLLLTAVAAAWTGSWYPFLSVPAQATRYCACFALALVVLNRHRQALALIVAASAATFAAHGIEALLGRAQFVDFILGTASRLEWDLRQSTAEKMLLLIGVLDLLCAAVIVALGCMRRQPRAALLVPAWMCLWGLLTAAVRVIEMGAANSPEALIRVANGTLPLTLLLVWNQQTRNAQ